MKKVTFIVVLILLMDQALKIYIKTHFYVGEEFNVIGKWFRLKFVENPGAAYGLHIGGYTGKVLLSTFRTLLSLGIVWWIYRHVKKGASNYFIIPMAMILAGAIGNLIDGMFYGVLFDHGTVYYADKGYWAWDVAGLPYQQQLSNLDFSGYSTFFFGAVVDMFYFPLFSFTWPDWMPIVGGQHVEFFRYIFNVADASISVGVFFLLIFKNRTFKFKKKDAS